MKNTKSPRQAEKSLLHPRSKHRNRYDFDQLTSASPALAEFVRANKYGDLSIDFFDPAAVKALNKAILHAHYQIDFWDIESNFLCPPIPGRADYVHYLADLLAGTNAGKIPRGKEIKGLDIGIGANGIYSILGRQEYGWSFVGSEIDTRAAQCVRKIIHKNPSLRDYVDVRIQQDPSCILGGIVAEDDVFDFTICNPPFYESEHAVKKEHLRKLKNLKQQQRVKAAPNFGGKSTELWCTGGEKQFVGTMIRESKQHARSCFWYTTLVSRTAHLDTFYKGLKTQGAREVKTISMAQGNKSSQVLAWTFLTPEQQTSWATERWQ